MLSALSAALLKKLWLVMCVWLSVRLTVLMSADRVLVKHHSLLECHSSCGNCVGTGKFGCEDCPGEMLLSSNECVSECPKGTCEDANQVECKPCPAECLSCNSLGQCNECSEGFYLSGEKCVDSLKCGAGTYLDSTTRRCESCYDNCVSCIGPYKNQCTDCSEEHVELATAYGVCLLVVCVEGQYYNGVSCVDCDPPCATCTSAGSCTKCRSSYASLIQNGTLLCQSCPEGYSFSSTGECEGENLFLNAIEICGDGRNLGSFECDDGNSFNGDGCSADCRVEPGFTCQNNPGGPDTCKDVTPPFAQLRVAKGNQLTIIFSEIVVSTVQCSFNC